MHPPTVSSSCEKITHPKTHVPPILVSQSLGFNPLATGQYAEWAAVNDNDQQVDRSSASPPVSA